MNVLVDMLVDIFLMCWWIDLNINLKGLWKDPDFSLFFLVIIFKKNEMNNEGEILTQTGGSPILFQHLFWFLGHPEVYIILLPALGITSEVVSTNARKPIFGYRAMVGSILAIAFLSFIVWGHHMFMTGMNPFLGSVFTFTTLLIAIPSAVKVFNYLTTLWKANIQFTPR